MHNDIPVLLDSAAQKAYEQLEMDLLLQVDENTITAGSAGVLTGKLLQLCNGAVYDSEWDLKLGLRQVFLYLLRLLDKKISFLSQY